MKAKSKPMKIVKLSKGPKNITKPVKKPVASTKEILANAAKSRSANPY